ncbi:MAG: S41 family peptidase [Granulosicoccus sp.]
MTHNSACTARRLPRLNLQRFGFLPGCLLLSLFLISACGVRSDETGGGSGDSLSSNLGNQGTASVNATPGRTAPLSCDIDDMKNWVYANMQDYYLFYEQVDQTLNTAAYNTVESLITDLRVAPFDTFSYITEEVEYNAFFNNGETFGFGWLFHQTDNNEFYFSLVEPGSPLSLAGVQRGDQLIAINGFDMPDFLQLSSADRTEILGTGDQVVTLSLTIGKPAGNSSVVSVTKAIYSLDTVLDTQIIERNGIRIGYLHFYQFLDTSITELADAFASLAAENVSEIVVDLRYNGGGRIYVANALASYLLGTGNTDKAFTTYSFNSKYQLQNESVRFENMVNALDINRVFVLQSQSTCSASELIVNGLRPFMDVITVGNTSCGKPYATAPNAACGKVMNALEIELVNANGVGGYFNGISADCPASENVAQQLGNTNENLLATALEYIDTGSCSAVSARSLAKKQVVPELELPQWRALGSL